MFMRGRSMFNFLYYCDPFCDVGKVREVFSSSLSALFESFNLSFSSDLSDVMRSSSFDVVFFDYGGLSCGANSFLFTHDFVLRQAIMSFSDTFFCLFPSVPSSLFSDEVVSSKENFIVGFEGLIDIRDLLMSLKVS